MVLWRTNTPVQLNSQLPQLQCWISWTPAPFALSFPLSEKKKEHAVLHHNYNIESIRSLVAVAELWVKPESKACIYGAPSEKKKVNRTLLKDSLMHGRTSSKCAEKNRQYTASALSKLIFFFITNTFFNVFHQRVIGIEITLMGNKESNCSWAVLATAELWACMFCDHPHTGQVSLVTGCLFVGKACVFVCLCACVSVYVQEK